MENKKYNKLERAQRRVLRIREFHRHVIVFIVINSTLWLFKDKIAFLFLREVALNNPKIMVWVDWNILIWGIILAIHALIIFGNLPNFVKKWEERKIDEFMNEEGGKRWK